MTHSHRIINTHKDKFRFGYPLETATMNFTQIWDRFTSRWTLNYSGIESRALTHQFNTKGLRKCYFIKQIRSYNIEAQQSLFQSVTKQDEPWGATHRFHSTIDCSAIDQYFKWRLELVNISRRKLLWLLENVVC